jgi:hypothetical protein
MSENPTIYDGEAGTCLDCGYPLQAVRPGKAQCDYCDLVEMYEVERSEVLRLQKNIAKLLKINNELQGLLHEQRGVLLNNKVDGDLAD